MEWVTPELFDLGSRDALRRGAVYGACSSPGSGDAGYCYSTGNFAGEGCDPAGNSDEGYCGGGNNPGW